MSHERSSGMSATTVSTKLKLKQEVVEAPPRKKARGPLTDDIADMMFGFGDSWPPNVQSINLVNSLVTEYVTDLSARAMQVASLRPDGKLDRECFLYLVRKDRQKFQRVNRLLTVNKELKRVQKVEVDEQSFLSEK